MKPEYAAYLDELMEEKRSRYAENTRAQLTRADLARAECNGWTVKFVKKFPHLRRVAGFYGDQEPDVENRTATEHWWCVDSDGTIVDPTFEQFWYRHGVYTVFDETKHRIKVGRCMNCGDDIFGLKSMGTQSCCSEECAGDLNEFYMRQLL